MLNRVFKKIENEKLIECGDKIVVGFSGGPDSVFLLQILLYAQKNIDFKIILAHINHMLRGNESDGDENFVVEYGKRLEIETFVKRVPIEKVAKEKKIGLEEAGREARYNFFDEILKKTSSNKIAIAHNLDDQIENFLFRMIRGTSLEGLEGIPDRGNIIRPINEIYKKNIVEFLDMEEVAYRVDKTNFENNYTRNSIRLDLIPYIEEKYNVNFKEKIHHLFTEIREVNEILKINLEKYVESNNGVPCLDIDLITLESKYIQRKIVKEYLKKYEIETSHEKIDNIIKLFDSGGSSSIDIGNGFILKKQYKIMWIEKEKQCFFRTDQKVDHFEEGISIEYNIPFKVFINGYMIEAKPQDEKKIQRDDEKEFLTNLNIGDTIEIRTRRNGDVMMPLGMSSYKKVKDIFINEKIPKALRKEIPILLKNNEIIWISGVKKSEKFKHTKNSDNIKLLIRRQNED